jgi:hypothetical protein
MTAVNLDDGELRRFLLGSMEDAEADAIRVRLLGEDELSDRMDLLEEELMEEFVDGDLSEEERARFIAYFLRTRERKARLQVIRGLQDIAHAQAGRQPIAGAEEAPRLPVRPSVSPFFAVAALAACTVLAVGSSLYVLREVGRLRASLDAIVQTTREGEPTTPVLEAHVSFALRPSDLTRGPAGELPTLRLPARAELVVLELALKEGAPVGPYSVDIASPPQTVWGSAGLTPERGVISARVPIVALPTGDYVATVTPARDQRGSFTYPFRVRR